MIPPKPKPGKRRPPPKSSALPIVLGLGGLLVVGGGIAVAMNGSKKTPPPAVQPPPTAVDPFSAARQRGLDAMNQARAASTTDFETKRKGYDAAKQAFTEALAAAPTTQQAQEIRTYINECNKSRPMGGK